MTLSFCPELDEIYRSGRAVGRSGRIFDNLGALSTANNLAILRALMLDRAPARTLEVGLSFGGSALAIAATHRELKHQQQHQHVAIDPYQTTLWDGSASLALERAGLDGFVDIREQPSAVALPALLAEGRVFDLIYVDGSHLFEDVFVDTYFCFRVLSLDGVMLFDDCTIDHVSKVLRFVTTNWRQWAVEVDLAPYRADGRSWRYQTAKWIGRTQLRAFRRTAAGTPGWDASFHDF